MSKATTRTLRQFYDAMYKALGPQKWWPGESPVEIIVGAILTQNTNWGNVERAIANLREAGLLDWRALHRIETPRLAELIRPAGYFNGKAQRLKNFVEWLCRRHDGDLSQLAKIELGRLREELLSINGVGPETADSILLYALERPSFVVDAYTARILRRHGMTFSGYGALQAIFEDHLPSEVGLFNEYHALMVAVGKHFCRPKARCEACPLRRFMHDETA